MNSGVKITSLAAAVPKRLVDIGDLSMRFGYEAAERIVATTGVHTRHIAEGQTLTAELAMEAADTALKHAGVRPESVNGIILITQTPEYKLPATACILQDRLGLPKNAIAFDVNLGCSGYPYGILIASSLISQLKLNKLLLIVGDITSATASPDDKSTYPIFADAFTATLIEKTEGDGDIISFSYGTDGSGWKHLVNHVGQIRNKNIEAFFSNGNSEIFSGVKYPEYTCMDGNEIFTFCLKVVPEMVKEALIRASLGIEDIDIYLFHQANLFILKNLSRKLGIPISKMPISLERYGNTSGASPALTACDYLSRNKYMNPLTVAIIGFGVGLSWSTVIIRLDPRCVCPIKEV